MQKTTDKHWRARQDSNLRPLAPEANTAPDNRREVNDMDTASTATASTSPRRRRASLILAALTLIATTACSSALPTAPEPVAAATFVPTMTTTITSSQNDRNINVTPETGMIPCDWATVPACGAHAFAACVQHGVGTGRPGPMAHWQWSEWQCFPTSYLPR